MLQIKNYSKNLNTMEIEQVLRLLPKKYQNLNIEIIFPRNKFHCLKWLYLKEYFYNIPDLFKGVLTGSSSIYYNKIFIYDFNYNFKTWYSQIEKMYVFETLFHEIRHQYQRQKTKRYFKKFNSNNDYKKNTPYELQCHEIDAKNFASKLMNELYPKIKMIIKKGSK